MDEDMKKKMVETIEGVNRGMTALAEMMKTSGSSGELNITGMSSKEIAQHLWDEHQAEILDALIDSVNISDLANEVADQVDVNDIAQYVDHDELARNLDIDCIKDSLVEKFDTDMIASSLFEMLVNKVVDQEVNRRLAEQKAQENK